MYRGGQNKNMHQYSTEVLQRYSKGFQGNKKQYVASKMIKTVLTTTYHCLRHALQCSVYSILSATAK